MVALEILQFDVLTVYLKTGIDSREIFMRMPTYIVHRDDRPHQRGVVRPTIFSLAAARNVCRCTDTFRYRQSTDDAGVCQYNTFMQIHLNFLLDCLVKESDRPWELVCHHQAFGLGVKVTSMTTIPFSSVSAA